MPRIVLFNKPFNVLTQFRAEDERLTLANFIQDKTLRVAGRLDYDSEGLLLLTDDGRINNQIASPDFKQFKTYWAQVDGIPDDAALQKLRDGVLLNDGPTLPAFASIIDEPAGLWLRNPPIRFRANIPTCWLEIKIREGRNRQVRRMTAAIGHPTLRLVRASIGPFELGALQPGELLELNDRDHSALFSCFKLAAVVPAPRSRTTGSPASRPAAPRAASRPSSRPDTASESRSRNRRRNTLPIAPKGK